MQSEGRIEHEATTVRGSRRKTKTVRRSGTPVVLTTTTRLKVHPDDETRFQSVYMTETPEQTLAILKAESRGKQLADRSDLEVWRSATSLLRPKQNDFENPPSWLKYVAERLPLEKVRVRRDWKRFLAFLSAIALCRPRPSDGPLNISFSDYCVAYKIFEPVLVAGVLKACAVELPVQELEVSQATVQLYKETGHAVTIRELAKHLDWKEKLVYKRVQLALDDRLVIWESGTRENNLKRLLPLRQKTKRFLPAPKEVLKNNSEIGKRVKYIHPFTGEWREIHK